MHSSRDVFKPQQDLVQLSNRTPAEERFAGLQAVSGQARPSLLEILHEIREGQKKAQRPRLKST